MIRSPCVSLIRLEPDVHTDAAVLFGVSRAYGVGLTKPSALLIYRRLKELLAAQPSPSLLRALGYCLQLVHSCRSSRAYRVLADGLWQSIAVGVAWQQERLPE